VTGGDKSSEIRRNQSELGSGGKDKWSDITWKSIGRTGRNWEKI
jgi:hypothetical protein